MNHLDYFASAKRPVETCVLGSGGFGRSFLAQGMRVPLMRARIAVDLDADIAAAAFLALGVPSADVARCLTAEEARQAWDQGKYIAADDLSSVVDLPIDVVVEATGNPEAGARHGRIAIEAGHHLVLVSKEVDSVVGPYLAHLARQHGKVATPVDGDQPSLLIGLITWAQLLGFDILAAGKASEYDFVYDQAACSMTSHGTTVSLPDFAPHWALGAARPWKLPKRGRRPAQRCRNVPCRICANCSSSRMQPGSCRIAPIYTRRSLVFPKCRASWERRQRADS